MDIWIKITVPHQTGKLCSYMNIIPGLLSPSFKVQQIVIRRESQRVLVRIENGLIYCLCSQNAIFELQLKPSHFQM